MAAIQKIFFEPNTAQFFFLFLSIMNFHSIDHPKALDFTFIAVIRKTDTDPVKNCIWSQLGFYVWRKIILACITSDTNRCWVKLLNSDSSDDMIPNTSLHTIVIRARITIFIMIRIIFPQISFGNGIQNLATNWSSCKKSGFWNYK